MDFAILGYSIPAFVIWKVISVAIILGLGFPLVRLVTRLTEKTLSAYGTPHVQLLVGKIVYYLGVLLITITFLNEFGFNLTALLGAAGIFGVAIGFAARTSMSNLISGLFLLSEKFLSIGDTISFGGVTGKIESMDLFSVKVRTPAGTLVRMANEQLIKNDLVNITFYPTQRIEVAIGIPADVPLDRVLQIIMAVVNEHDTIAVDPKPYLILNSLSTHAQHVTLRAWTEYKHFVALKTILAEQLYNRLKQEGIEVIFVSPVHNL